MIKQRSNIYKNTSKKIKLPQMISKKCNCEEEEEEMVFLPMMEDMMPHMMDRDQNELESRGIILINSLISKPTLAKATKRLLLLHFNPEFQDDIQIILNSPGGFCDAGWAFLDTMNFVKNRIITIAMGEIASMATSIFITGDHRIMAPNSTAMIHQFSGATEGNYSDLLANRKAEDMEMKRNIAHLIRYSKYVKEKQIKKYILKSHDNWLSPQEMKKHGLCDEVQVIRSRRPKKKMK